MMGKKMKNKKMSLKLMPLKKSKTQVNLRILKKM